MSQNSKNFRDFLKTQKAKPKQKSEINKFNLLYENPQEFIKTYKLLFPLNQNIIDQNNITAIQHYFLAMENCLISKEEENYKFLFNYMNEFFDYILQNFQVVEQSIGGKTVASLDTILHYLAKKKKFDYLFKICEFYRNYNGDGYIIQSQLKFGELCLKKNEAGLEFFKYLKYDLNQTTEVTNKIYEVLLEIPKVSEIILFEIENIRLVTYFEEFGNYLKTGNIHQITLYVTNMIDKLSENQFTELFFYKDTGFSIFNYLIDKEERKRNAKTSTISNVITLFQKLLNKISTFKNKEKIIFNHLLSTVNNILIYSIKKDQIMISNILLKFLNENINFNSNEINDDDEKNINNFLDETIFLDDNISKNNIFHLISSSSINLNTSEHKIIFDSVVKFIEKYNPPLISKLINKLNNFGEVPLITYLNNKIFKIAEYSKDEVLVTLLNLTNLEIFDQSKSTLKKIRIIHPSELLLKKLNSIEEIENFLKFLDQNNLFSPFYNYEISSKNKKSRISKSILSFFNKICPHEILSEESKSLIFSNFFKYIEQEERKDEKFSLILNSRDNFYEMLNFINIFKHGSFSEQTFIEKLVSQNKIISLISPQKSDESFHLQKTFYLMKNEILLKTKNKFNFSQYFTSLIKDKLNFDKYSSMLIKPLITYLNVMHEKEHFISLLKVLLETSPKETLVKLLIVLCEGLNDSKMNYLFEFINSNQQIIGNKFDGLHPQSNTDQEEFSAKIFLLIFPFYFQKIKVWSRKFYLFNSLINLISDEFQFVLKGILKNLVANFKFSKLLNINKNYLIQKNNYKYDFQGEIDFHIIKYLIGVYCLDDKVKKLEYFDFYDKISSNGINLFFRIEKNEDIMQANKFIKEIILDIDSNKIGTDIEEVLELELKKEQIKFQHDLIKLLFNNLSKVIQDSTNLFNLYFNPILSYINKKISLRSVDLKKNYHEIEKMEIHIHNLISRLLPICTSYNLINSSKSNNYHNQIYKEITDEDELILIKNFIFYENNKNINKNESEIRLKINEIKRLLKNTKINKYEEILQNSFKNKISFLFENFDHEKEKDYLLIRYIKNLIHKNKNYKQILLSSFPINFCTDIEKDGLTKNKIGRGKSTNSSDIILTNSILAENSNFLTSYNPFCFIFNYDSISNENLKSQYFKFFKQIRENDKTNNYICEKDSKFVSADSKFLLKFVKSFPLEQLLTNFYNYFSDLTKKASESNQGNESIIYFNDFLSNKSYAESLSYIIYNLLKKYFDNKIKINTKILEIFIESYAQFSQLFDHKNEYNSKLILITVKLFVYLENKNPNSVNTQISNKYIFVQNILKIDSNPYYNSLESFISSLNYLLQELLNCHDLKYFESFTTNLLKINNNKNLLTIILNSTNGLIKKIIYSYLIFTENLEYLKLVENILNIDLLERFDLKDELIFKTIKNQKNKFSQFLHKFNNSTLYYFGLLIQKTNNFTFESKIVEYLKSKILFEKLIDLYNEEKFGISEKNLNFDLVKSILISKNFHLIKKFHEILIFADLDNYYIISKFYINEKNNHDYDFKNNIYETYITKFLFLFTDFNLAKLFTACINTNNMTLAKEIYKNKISITDKKNLILNSYEIDEKYKKKQNNFNEKYEDLISTLIINNEPGFLQSIIEIFRNDEEKLKILTEKKEDHFPLEISIRYNSFYSFIILFDLYPSVYINTILKNEKIFFTRMINLFKQQECKQEHDKLVIVDPIHISQDIPFRNFVKIYNPELYIIFTIHEYLLTYLNESNRSDISLIYENLRLILFSGFKSIGKEIIQFLSSFTKNSDLIYQCLILMIKVLKMDLNLDEIFTFLLQNNKQNNNEEVFLMLFYILEEDSTIEMQNIRILNVKEYLNKREIEKIKNIKLFFDIEKISALSEYKKIYLNKNRNIEWIENSKIFLENECMDIYLHSSSNGAKKLNKIIFHEFKIIEKIELEKLSYSQNLNILMKEMFNDYNLFSEGLNLLYSLDFNFQSSLIEIPIIFKFKINLPKDIKQLNLNVFELTEIKNMNYFSVFQKFKKFEREMNIYDEDIEQISSLPEFLNYKMMLFILLIFNSNEFLNLMKILMEEMHSKKLNIKNILTFFYDLFKAFLTYFKNINEKEEYENLLFKNRENFQLMQDYLENVFYSTIDELINIFYNEFSNSDNRIHQLINFPFLKEILRDSQSLFLNLHVSKITTEKNEPVTSIQHLEILLNKLNHLTSVFNEFIIYLSDINSNIYINIFELNSAENLNKEFKKELKLNFQKENNIFFKEVIKTFQHFKYIEERLKIINFDFVRLDSPCENIINLLKDSNLEIEKIKKENSEKLSQNILHSLKMLKVTNRLECLNDQLKIVIPYYFDMESKCYKDSIFGSNIITYIQNFYTKYLVILKATCPLGSTPISIYPELFSTEYLPIDQSLISGLSKDNKDNCKEIYNAEINSSQNLLNKSYECFLTQIGSEKEKLKFNLFLKMKLEEGSKLENLIISEFPNFSLNEYFLNKFKLFLQDFSNSELKTLDEFIFNYLYLNENGQTQNLNKNEISFSDLFFSNKKYEEFLYDINLKIDFYKNLLTFNFLDKSKNVNLQIDFDFLNLLIEKLVEFNTENIIYDLGSSKKELVNLKIFNNLFESKRIGNLEYDTRKNLNNEQKEVNNKSFQNFDFKKKYVEILKQNLYSTKNSLSYIIKYVIDRSLYNIKKIKPETKLNLKVNFEANYMEIYSSSNEIEINPYSFTYLAEKMIKLINLEFIHTKLEKKEEYTDVNSISEISMSNSNYILNVEVLLTLGINKFKSVDSDLERDFIYYLFTNQINLENICLKKDFIPNSDYDYLIKHKFDNFIKNLEETLKLN